MMKNKMIPDGDEAKLAMAKNVAAKLPKYAAKFGIGPDEVTDIANSVAAFEYTLDILGLIGTYKQNWTSLKNLLRDGPDTGDVAAFPAALDLGVQPTAVDPGLFTRISGIAARIKNHPAYTDNIGQDLGIVGSEQTFDPSTGKPVITASFLAGQVLIGWTKGNFDGVRIEVDRADGKGYVFLAIDTQPDYTDSTPLPPAGTSAIWKYRAIYLLADEVVGQWSDEVKVTVAA